ncbi:MAG: 50S ribosomal protein L18 [Bacteroidetes bacterium]|nr:50S ribosomal protein L18 [Bacteroidota bacterium]MDA1119487.1 50S ribosomal protein L18 [Bacteroidota bacterium]
MAISKGDRRLRIRRGIRNKISGTSERPRLSVFKSNKGIYAQLIDDSKGNTLAFSSSEEIGQKGKRNIEVSKNVGKKLAEKAKGLGIELIVFDRGGYPYHGRVKALAESAREGGLKF